MTTAKPSDGNDGRGWGATAKGLATLLAVLAVPFLLRPRDNLLDESGESVVILTAHNEPYALRVRPRLSRAHARRRVARCGSTGARPAARARSHDSSPPNTPRRSRATGRPTCSDPGRAAWPPRSPTRAWRWATANRAMTKRKLARRAFLDSDVGIGIDLLFGTGATEAAAQASAGRLVDAGLVRSRPELFGERVFHKRRGANVIWDNEGRWVGTCLTLFGICYNKDALARLGVKRAPAQWSDLADPAYFGAAGHRRSDQERRRGHGFRDGDSPADEPARRGARRIGRRCGRGHRSARAERGVGARHAAGPADRGQRSLLRRVGERSATLDIAMGDAAAGMCIDFYGRFQSEIAGGGAGRLGFVTPHGGTAVDSDPIGLFRGAPHRELAIAFIEFVLSPRRTEAVELPRRNAGRPAAVCAAAPAHPARSLRARVRRPSLGSRRKSVRGGARVHLSPRVDRTALAHAHLRRPGDVPRRPRRARRAYRALFRAGFPPRATALFDDVRLIDYAAATGPIRTALSSGNPVDEAALGNRLVAAAEGSIRPGGRDGSRAENDG